MKALHVALIVIIAAITGFAAAQYAAPKTTVKKAETRFDQIKRTGVIRCGYTIWPPAISRDPNTGQISGIFYDLMEEIGKKMDLEIKWTTEVSPAHMFTDMSSNRYDMVCSPYAATPARARESSFSVPIFYNSLNLYARADDARFDNNRTETGKEATRFAIVEGNVMSMIANAMFPDAQKITLPNLSTPTDSFLHVAGNKADLVISEPLTYALFNNNNPNVIKPVAGGTLQTIGAGFPLPVKEHDLKEAIDHTLLHLHGTGFIDHILTKHEPKGARLLRVSKPYAP